MSRHGVGLRSLLHLSVQAPRRVIQKGKTSSSGLRASSTRKLPIRSQTRSVKAWPLAAVAARGSPDPELVVRMSRGG